jgi:hypothetical protein
MAILAECDICGNQHRVKDSLAGSLIHCNDCGVKIVVPKDQFITPEAFVEEAGRLRRREPEKKTSIWTWLVVFIVASFVLFSLLVSIWIFVVLIRPIPKQVHLRNNESSTVALRLSTLNPNRFRAIDLA